MISRRLPTPRFDHLQRLTTPDGLFEHALLTEPREDHGYCLDDVSRGLVVAVREPDPTAEVSGMVTTFLRFTAEAQDEAGAFHNRRSTERMWTDSPSVDDHWGRALWAVGTTAALASGDVREQALAVASTGMQARSPWPRAMAYAALGGAEVLRTLPGDRAARELLVDARSLLGRPRMSHGWPWPEPRLTYANAVLPEALIAIGHALHDDAVMAHGLDLLQWLLHLQTRDGHISVIPAGGAEPGDALPGFDQQPIEVSALAEACWRAHEATGDARWVDAVHLCADWFLGANDVGLTLYDRATGGCSDGLHSTRINLNQGAESTLAALSVLQLARRPALVAAR
ncbi:MAG TPA: hypothetical protein VLQ92_07765 [Candidatus Limnocylindrales bacterium]|nr:hypothetical protein [Candidatus Limnocylindrales bacterium]